MKQEAMMERVNAEKSAVSFFDFFIGGSGKFFIKYNLDSLS